MKTNGPAARMECFMRGDRVVHIELRRWADILVIAPLDANTLAKFACGLNDNCLTCVWRAWDRDRPIVLPPAMNTLMWEHSLTRRHLRQLAEDAGTEVVPRSRSDGIDRVDERQLSALADHRADQQKVGVRGCRRRCDGGQRGDCGDCFVVSKLCLENTPPGPPSVRGGEECSPLTPHSSPLVIPTTRASGPPAAVAPR